MVLLRRLLAYRTPPITITTAATISAISPRFEPLELVLPVSVGQADAAGAALPPDGEFVPPLADGAGLGATVASVRRV